MLRVYLQTLISSKCMCLLFNNFHIMLCCKQDLKKQHWQLKMHFRVEETGKLQWFKGQILNYDPTSGQYGVFPSANHLLIRQYTCIQMTRMSISWTSCSLCISHWSSQHIVYSYWFIAWWHVSIDFRSYVHSNSHPGRVIALSISQSVS